MNQIFTKVQSVDPNDSDAVKEVLHTFFLNLSNNKDINNVQWLRVLLHIVNRFPKFCSTHRATAETYVTKFISASSYYSVVEAAKCAHALQQIRPLQNKGATPKSCWRELMEGLCDASHLLIDNLFTKTPNLNRDVTVEKDNYTNTILHTALKSIDTTQDGDVINKNTVLCTRLKNIFIFIQAMLVEVYPVPKPIQPQIIFETILRALSSSGNDDSSKLTTIKIEALRTLDAFIACAGSNLIPFSALIFRFVMHTLRWSFENSSEETIKVRIQGYNSLSLWLSTLGTYRPMADSKRSWDEELTTMIISDVTPPKHVIQLQANPQSMKNLSKKARKRLANNMLNASNISNHKPGEKNKINANEESNDDLIIAALECAETFLIVCGLFLKPTIHKQLQELLVRECYSLAKYSTDRSLALLQALEASRKCTSSKVPPPTQYCLQLYSVLRNHSQREISKFCSHALLDIKLHLHCSPPSLNYAFEHTDRQRDDKKKRISERNRAVLESLLGKEKMPTEILNEEIITIPDEPIAKKPRNDVITDKISLSSESVNSVEVSEDSDTQDDVEIVIAEAENGDNDVLSIEPVISEEHSSTDIIQNNDVTDVIDEETVISEEHSSTDIIQNNDVTDAITEEIVKSPKDNEIHEAVTQLHISNDTLDGEKSPVSMEVAYDLNTGTDKVNVIKIDDENLPSTNETDDIQITCGQVVKSSQDEWKNKDETKENGIKTPERIENGITDNGINETEPSKIAPKADEVTVEDMLADFVDEVNEEALTQA